MNCRLINFQIMGDDRESLVALEENYNIPFDTKEGVRRAYHAHLDLKQIAICVKGACIFVLDDEKSN